ncbi:MAG: hypothetical protein JKX76_00865 [Colwellia sp.]|nr:hypothetical protein [Colwellia sp.]
MTEYNIDEKRNLVDLNGDFENFDSTFKVIGNTPFQGVVVNQDTIDEGTELEWRDADQSQMGFEISGSLMQDGSSGDPSSDAYYIALRSTTEQTVIVHNNVKEIARAITNESENIPDHQYTDGSHGQNQSPQVQVKAEKQGQKNWMIIGVVFAIIIMLICVFMFNGKGGKSLDLGSLIESIEM